MPFLLAGAAYTIQLSLLSIFVGLALGWLFGLFSVSHSRVLRAITKVYVELIRGTPLLVQILLIYFGLAGIGLNLSVFWASVISLGLNSGGFQAEIVRAGVQSIDMGQTEAARSIGLSGVQTLLLILVPQAVRRVIPPLTNELISLVKGSSLLSAIGAAELTHNGEVVIAATFSPFEIYIAVAAIYLVMLGVLARLSRYVEKRIPVY